MMPPHQSAVSTLTQEVLTDPDLAIHTEAELAVLMEIGRHRIAPDQLALELTPTPPAVPGLLTASARLALTRWWRPSARPCCGTFCTGPTPVWG